MEAIAGNVAVVLYDSLTERLWICINHGPLQITKIINSTLISSLLNPVVAKIE